MRAAIRGKDEIIRVDDRAGSVEVRQVAVGEDENSSQNKTILQAEDG